MSAFHVTMVSVLREPFEAWLVASGFELAHVPEESPDVFIVVPGYADDAARIAAQLRSAMGAVGDREPLTVAGPAFARAIAEHIDRPVPEAAVGFYTVHIDGSGAVTWYPEGVATTLDGDSATAKNIRGMLLALHAGAIA